MRRPRLCIASSYSLLCAVAILMACISGCGNAGRSGAGVVGVVSAQKSQLNAQTVKMFFGADLSEDSGNGDLAALATSGVSQGVELASKPWMEVRQQVTEGSLLPVLLAHKTRPPAVLADIFAFEGDTYFLLLTLDAEPFVLQGKNFSEAGWTGALWRPHCGGKDNTDVIDIGSAKVSVSKLWHSFGATTPFSVAHTSFTLSNVSKTSLELASINTSCGCTKVAGVQSTTIPPGGTVVIPVSVQTASESIVQQSVVVTLMAQAGDTPTFIKFKLFGWQPAAIESIPRNLDFGLVLRDQPAKATVRLTEPPGDLFQVESIDVGKLPITAAVARTGDGDDYLVDLQLTVGGLSIGDHSGLVRIKNNSRRRPMVEIPVRFSVASEIKARPGIVEFTDFSLDGSNTPVTVTFEHRKKEPLKISVLNIPDALTAEIRDVPSQVVFSVRKHQLRSSTGTIRLSVHWQDGEEIVELPFYLFLR